jgi:hypothetical protein
VGGAAAAAAVPRAPDVSRNRGRFVTNWKKQRAAAAAALAAGAAAAPEDDPLLAHPAAHSPPRSPAPRARQKRPLHSPAAAAYSPTLPQRQLVFPASPSLQPLGCKTRPATGPSAASVRSWAFLAARRLWRIVSGSSISCSAAVLAGGARSCSEDDMGCFFSCSRAACGSICASRPAPRYRRARATCLSTPRAAQGRCATICRSPRRAIRARRFSPA